MIATDNSPATERQSPRSATRPRPTGCAASRWPAAVLHPLWICQGAGDLGRTRPLTDVEDLVRQLHFVRENPGEAERLARDAQDWVLGLRWERIVSEYWLPLFAQAARSRGEPEAN